MRMFNRLIIIAEQVLCLRIIALDQMLDWRTFSENEFLLSIFILECALCSSSTNCWIPNTSNANDVLV